MENNANRSVTLTGTSSTANISTHGPKRLIDTIVKEDSIEFIYRSEPQVMFGGTPPMPKIWKEVIKSVDGKLAIVENIEARYIPPQDEYYVFD